MVNHMTVFEGKRVLVFWTTAAHNRGDEWKSFMVLDESDEGIFCKGVNAPNGAEHDGTKCFIKFSDTLDILEWREDA